MRARRCGPGAAIYLALCLLPLLGLMTGGGDMALTILSARRTALLGNTLLLGALTAALCSVIGFLAAVGIRQSRWRFSPMRWGFLLLAPVPSYVYALSWMQLIRLVGKFWPQLLRAQIAGLAPCVAVETLCFLPLCTALALVGLERTDGPLVEAGLLCQSGDRVVLSILLPSTAPLLLAGAGSVFVLSAADFSIPSLFQYNVYAMELFSEFSAAGKAVNAFYLALPLILLTLLAVALAQSGVCGITAPMRSPLGGRLPLSPMGNALCKAAVGACLLQILLPFTALLLTAGGAAGILESLELMGREFSISCQIGLLAVGISLPIACAAAPRLMGRRQAAWRIALLFPLALPGALVGIGWLGLLNGSPLHGLTQTVLFPALGCASRFAPFAMLIMAGVMSRRDSRRIEVARLLQRKRGEAFWRVLVPMAAPGVLAAGLTVFLLTLGEVGATLVLTPPGGSPISIKIYNYLHYGASELVSGFCLIQTTFCALAMAAVMKLLTGRGRGCVGSKKFDETI